MYELFQILWGTWVIFRSPKDGIFFVHCRRRYRRRRVASSSAVFQIPHWPWAVSSLAHMTSISRQHRAKNYPWLHCRGGGMVLRLCRGRRRRGGADICSWKISIVTLKEKSQTPSRIYTHTILTLHIASQKQCFACTLHNLHHSFYTLVKTNNLHMLNKKLTIQLVNLCKK